MEEDDDCPLGEILNYRVRARAQITRVLKTIAHLPIGKLEIPIRVASNRGDGPKALNFNSDATPEVEIMRDAALSNSICKVTPQKGGRHIQ